jgi:hypothetical protein
MKIMRKDIDQYINFAIWYLTEIKHKATASEIVSFAEENDLTNKSFTVTTAMMARALRFSNAIKGKKKDKLVFTYQINAEPLYGATL